MDERSVGANIRAIRRAAEASLSGTASRAGISKSTLSKIERGQISSPISTLFSIASALGVRLADFFREEAGSPGYVLTRKGMGRMIVRDGTRFGYSYEALALEFPDKPAEPFLLEISPGDKEGTFRHGGQEFVHVISGQVEFALAEDRIVMRQGDSLYFDPTIQHSVRLVGKKPARFLCIFIENPKKP